ncbi:MAG: universal stress protein, partial [bacterium]
MGRYRKMLIAVDGSDSSRNAFRQACVVARGNDSWITVLTAIPIYEDQFEVLSTRETIVRTLREEGEKIISGIRKIAEKEDVFIKTRVEEGSPFQAIIDVSEENNYDLIVMGRRGQRRLEKALVGSVTARVIGHSRRDVLVIPRNATLGWKHILLATDGSRFSAAAADKAIVVAKSYDSKLKVVSIVDVTEEFYAQAPDVVE